MQEQFKAWFNKLKKIWETKNPDAIINICAEKFLWYETPFDQPLTTKEQLLKEWRSILTQDNIRVSYEILSVNGNVGIAQWHGTFERLPSREKVELDGIFKVLLDEQGRCIEFHQWFNSKD